MIVLKDELKGLDPKGRHCEICKRHMHEHEWADLDMNGFVTDCNFHYCACPEDEQISSTQADIGLWCIKCNREIIIYDDLELL